MLWFVIAYTLFVIITTAIIIIVEKIKVTDNEIFLALSFGLAWPLFWLMIILILCSFLVSEIIKKILRKWKEHTVLSGKILQNYVWN